MRIMSADILQLVGLQATMMGQTMDTEEDQEAMDMLVFNAQKLNQVNPLVHL